MKTIALFLSLVIPGFSFGQTATNESSMYLGQPKPGMTPVVFAPKLVSLPNRYEFGSVFSSKGDEFYFAVDSAGKAEIRFMKLQNNQWTKPVTLLTDPVFSHNDPMLSVDESKLFFISDSPLDQSGKKKDYDIWYVERKGNGWSAPINAGPAINSPQNEYYVSFSKKGTLYFSSNRTEKPGQADNYTIYAAPLKSTKDTDFSKALPLSDAINTPHYEADVYVVSDESYLIFCGTWPSGYGAGDLYISFKKPDGTWTKAKNMGEIINTPGHELCPFISRDGKYLFYTSGQDIYWVDAQIINTLR